MRWRGALDNENINALVTRAAQEAEKAGTEGEQRLRFRLSLEEVLLRCREAHGESAAVSLRMKRSGRQLTARLTLLSAAGELPAGGDSPLSDLLSGWEQGPGANSLLYTLRLENSKADLFRFAWRYTRPQKWWFFLGVLTQLISTGILIVAPLISARVIVAFSDGLAEQVMLAAASLLVINAVAAVVNIACNRAYNVVYNKTLTLLEADLVHHALKITSRCLDQKGTGLFIQRLTQDTSQLATGFNTLADLISQAIEKVGILAAVLILNPVAFAAMVAILLLQTAIETVRTRRLKADDQLYRNANERYTDFVSEMVHGAKDVKLTHSESTFETELVHRITDANGKRMRMQNRSAVFSLFRMEVGAVGNYLFIALLALMLSRQSISAADALILFNYQSSIGVSSIQLIGTLMEFVRGLELSAERVMALLNSPEFPRETFGTRHLDTVRGEIAFENVFFSYAKHPFGRSSSWVIRDMSFVIHPGETVALVGRSGCGKTTVFNLISKLYEATEGTIRIDGVDIRELDEESVRGRQAVVTQNPYLFQLSIRENLRLVKQDMTDGEMREACRLACIDQDIERKRDGYDTMIDENGVNLSGGQRQRLAIARALLKDFRVLMLDEATSALDNVTQARIQQAIENVRENRTVLMIAHRLSTVVGADRILFMEDGHILDEGTHRELMERCGPYRRLYETEMGKA